MVRSYAALMEVAVPQAWDTRVSDADRASTLDRHKAMARTIADGDPVAAVAAMEAHFDASITGLVQPDYSL
jgi:DNA-binding FadR family transcriptional regulator